MMYSQNRAALYRSVSGAGLIAEASPARLVQISFESILSHLAVAQGCMERITDNRPVSEVVNKGNAIGKALRLIGHLNDCLDMSKGGAIAQNLRQLYLYMLERLSVANAANDAGLVEEVAALVRKIKGGWDEIVAAEQ